MAVLHTVDLSAHDVESVETLESELESVSPEADVSAAPAEKSDRGIRYRNGGVGKEERDALLLVTRRYTLKIVLAKKVDRAFVYDATIRVLDARGATILEAANAGPLFFADLPPGEYKVIATAHERSKEQRVTVTAGTQAAISFSW